MLKHNFAYKESLRVGMLLTATAGYIDAYTFAFHDEKFASFQSGNILQLGINLASGHFIMALQFLAPILGFLLGAMLNQVIKQIAQRRQTAWEPLAVLVELVGILFVALLEIMHVPSLLVISLLGLFMAIQADTFGKLRGMPYATVLSTGNLKTFGATIANGLLKHDAAEFIKTRTVGVVILAFFSAAVLSHFITLLIGDWALLLAPLFLLGVLFFIRQDS